MEQPKNNFKLVTEKKNARMLLPNMLTLIGVCIGLTSIRFALSGEFHLAIRSTINGKSSEGWSSISMASSKALKAKSNLSGSSQCNSRSG